MTKPEKKSNIFTLISDNADDDFSNFLAEGEIDFDPVGGDPVVGQLTESEKLAYRTLLGIEARIVEFSDEIVAAANTKIANQIISSGGLPDESLFAGINDKEIIGTYASEFFMLSSLHRYRNAEFWYKLRKRLQIFANNLAIRAGYSVVNTGHKLPQ